MFSHSNRNYDVSFGNMFCSVLAHHAASGSAQCPSPLATWLALSQSNVHIAVDEVVQQLTTLCFRYICLRTEIAIMISVFKVFLLSPCTSRCQWAGQLALPSRNLVGNITASDTDITLALCPQWPVKDRHHVTGSAAFHQ